MQFWKTPAVLACVLSLALPTLAAPKARDTGVETRSIDEIYSAALAESKGKTLQVAWGGDEKSNATALAFMQAFPGIAINLTVDVSKYHDSHTDRAFIETGKDIYDIAFLQTLHDFPRWKEQGRLMSYKAKPWESIYNEVKDSEGYYYAGFFISFGNIVFNSDKRPLNTTIPTTYTDFLLPAWKDKIVLTYPNDDDAIAYLFALIIEKYGWGWFTSLMAQNVTWVRGSTTPGTMLANPASPVSITFCSFGTGEENIHTVEPADRYMSWAQTGAIFASTEMPETAKLFVSWIMSDEYQTASGSSTRRELAAEDPFSKQWTEPLGFAKWMGNRQDVEWYKLQFESLLGTAQGESPLEDDL